MNEPILTQAFEGRCGVSEGFTRKGVDSDTKASMRQMSSKLPFGQAPDLWAELVLEREWSISYICRAITSDKLALINL